MSPLGVAFSWHQLGFEELRALVRHAEAKGFAAAYVDGDVSVIPSLGERDVLDGFTVTTALLAATERIAVTSIRLVHHWNAARLAQGRSIGSGLVEGACKQVIGRRLKQTGARWRVRRVERMAALCAVQASGQWAAYWAGAA